VSERRVVPSVARGRCRAPPSKSYTHRALVVAHLAHRRYRIAGPLDSDDTQATASALEHLGSRVARTGPDWVVSPGPDRDSTSPCQIDCGESGTTLRFLAALAAQSRRRVRLVGRGRLPSRPIEPLLAALRSLGARCVGPRNGRTLPVTIEGPLRAGPVIVDASESSQFASALLLVLPVLPGDSSLRLRGRIVSGPYLDATGAMLRASGLRFVRKGREFRIPGGQTYLGSRFEVPGDASSAAYLWTAAALTGGRIAVTGVPDRWPQADLAILDILASSGAQVRRRSTGASVAGGRHVPFSVDLTACPDLYPLVGVIAAYTPGRSRLRGAPQIVLKESDRRAGTERLVRALHARSQRTGGGLAIDGGGVPAGFALRGETDHRIVMSAAVAAFAARTPSSIGDAHAVRKSFPGFWQALDGLRIGRSDR